MSGAAHVMVDWEDRLRMILEYKNPDVIFSFCGAFDIAEEEAERIFVEMLKWLWFCRMRKSTKTASADEMAIDHPLLIIDEMWHAFILHTKAYSAFCDKHFGHYVHHQPTTRADAAASAPYDDEQALRESKRAKYSKIYDVLGEATFRTWYLEFPRTYSMDAILRLRKK